ncbi:MAG: hypothetical protein JSU74_03940 [Candidatus Zixiibacteriota bacterium]|nr:MAG: hypothetical protein JSU74_03940 [candidate division Zixibacteria bacterium]
MVKRLRLILPLLFVLIFAFSLVLSMQSTAVASGPCNYLPDIPGCCIMTVWCKHGVIRCGYGVWNGYDCVHSPSGECPSGLPCPPPP